MQSCIFGTIPNGLTVFETMRAEADGYIRLWPLHLGRLRRNCRALGFVLDEAQLADLLVGVTPTGSPQRLRLTVDGRGETGLTRAALPDPAKLWRVTLSDRRVNSADPWLTIKSTQRALYDETRANLPSGIDEVLFCNERGEVCEGTISNLFLLREGSYMTPPLRCGLLPGILRQSLLESGQALEAVLAPDDLARGKLFCGNALRGLIPAELSA